MSGSTARERFQRTLQRLQVAARRRLLLHALLAVVAFGGGALLLAAAALGRREAPSVALKVAALLWCLALAAVILQAFLARPWRRLRDRAALARSLEGGGGFSNLLVAAEEAARRPDRWGGAGAATAVLVERLFATASRLASGVSLARLLPLPAAGRLLIALAAVGICYGWMSARIGRELSLGLDRLVHPLRQERVEALIGLYLAPGPTQIVAGDTVVVAALDFGRAPRAVEVETRSGSGLWRASPAVADSLSPAGPAIRWEARLPEVRETFTYRFRRDRQTTPARTMHVVHPPLLAAWGARVTPPRYTRLPEQELPQLPARLHVPSGSRLSWAGRTGDPVAAAAVLTATGDSLPLRVNGVNLSGELEVAEPLAYVVSLRDDRGLANRSRVTYEITVAPDADPTARLWRPGGDGTLPVEARADLLAEAQDDFGLARLELLVRRELGQLAAPVEAVSPLMARESGEPLAAAAADSAAWHRVPVWSRGRQFAGAAGVDSLAVETPWGRLVLVAGAAAVAAEGLHVRRVLLLDASGLELVPGDALALCLEALDNREPGPPGRGRSPVLRLTLPSAAEVLGEQLAEGQQRLDEMGRMRERGHELTAELERLQRELKKDPLPDWSRQQELEAALERQRALQDEAQRLSEQVRQDLDTAAENRLGSPELLGKMEEVSSLLRELHNAELDELLERLREAAAGLSPEQVREAMEELARNQEELSRRLDQAIAMLKELARHQELEGMTAVVERLLREQQALNDAATPPPGESADEAADAENLARRQEALAEEAERLAEKMREALERLQREAESQPSPSSEPMQQALEEALRQLEQEQTARDMRDAARRMREENGDSPPPAAPQEQALRELAALYHIMLRGQLGMQMAMKQFLTISLRRVATDLLDLSAQQEQIAGVVPSDLRGVAAAELIRRQNRLLRAGRQVRDRLQEVNTRSGGVPARLLQDLDGVVAQLQATLERLEHGFGTPAQQEARQSLAGLNRMVIGLLTAAEQMGAGQGSGSMMSSAQRLQQMARDQAGLNALGEQLQRQMSRGRLSQEARSQMERLQSGQQGLAGQMRELNEEQRRAPAGERILGDLADLAQEMERVSESLAQGLIDENLQRRQERILSRLLDAHNSVRERDYEARRESRTARRLYDDQQGPTSGAERDGEGDPLRLRREPVEKAPPEYRDLVRRYFQALERFRAPPFSPPGAAAGDRPGPVSSPRPGQSPRSRPGGAP